MMKKKILVFNGWYLPSKRCGGPVTSIRNTVNACCDEFDFYIVALNHDFGSSKKFTNISDGWNQVENAKVLYIEDGYFDFNSKRLTCLFDSVKPDLIWFSGILHPQIKFCTMRICNKKKISVLFSPRGEVSEDRVAIKAYKKMPFLFFVSKLGIYKNAWFHATSDDEYEGLKKYIGAKKDKIILVRNIAVAPWTERINYEKKEGIVRIAFISRLHLVKNLDYAIRVASAVQANVIFDIYGPKEVPTYWDECERLIKNASSNVQIQYCGVLAPDKVGETFRKYDCFLFPTINENYGHVIAEALATGCLLVLSKGTTPWDDLHHKAGCVCALDSPQEFTRALEYIAAMDSDTFSEVSKRAIQYYMEKLKCDSAVQGHKSMFYTIMSHATDFNK